MNYIDYIMEMTQKLIAIPSPSGFTHNAARFLCEELTKLGYVPKLTNKGSVLVDLGGEDAENAVLLAAHIDTLGAMVTQIKENGRLKLTNIGGLNPNNTEAENCHIHTRDGKIYDATFQLTDASVHVNGNYSEEKRTYDSMEALIDEEVSSKADVEALGIMAGDYVCFDPRTVVTESGYIKSRFLDDKLSAAMLLALAKEIKDNNRTLKRKVYLHFTVYEEVGHGASASVPSDAEELISVDMGCVGDGLTCTEREVSICAKDSGGPYNYAVTTALVEAAKSVGAKYAVDVYPHYGSDVEASLRSGWDVRHGLIGAGVYASHGYERSHIEGVENTLKLLEAYVLD